MATLRLRAAAVADIRGIRHYSNTSVFLDWATDAGPMRLNGIKVRFVGTTASTSSTTGSVTLAGGMGVAKSIVAGDATGSANGYFVGANKVVGARGASLPLMPRI